MFSVFHFSLRSEVITKITTVWTKIKTQMIKLADFFLLVICCVYHKFDFKQRCKSFNCSILIRRYATGNYILMLIRTNPKVNWFRFAFDRITTVWPWFERIKKKDFLGDSLRKVIINSIKVLNVDLVNHTSSSNRREKSMLAGN